MFTLTSAMFCMVMLTVILGLITFKVRVQSVKNKETHIKDLRLTNYDTLPSKVVQSSKCFNNQFEIPVLFYVVCSLFVMKGTVDSLTVWLAFLFVFFRILHAAVFITYNNVLHRLVPFWISFFIVIALWIKLFLEQV